MQHCFADDAQVAGIAHSFVILNLFQDNEPQSHVIPITVNYGDRALNSGLQLRNYGDSALNYCFFCILGIPLTGASSPK